MRRKKGYKSHFERKTLKVKRMLCSFTLVLGLIDVLPAFPTGKLLVRTYTSTDQDLYIMNEDGTGLRAIETTSEWAAGADFSPDRKTILYATTTPGYGYNIYQVPVAGGTPRIVPGCAGIALARPCWGNSPDHFYYSTETGGPCGSYDTEIHKRTYALDSEGLLDELISDEIIVEGKNIWLNDVQEDLNKMAYTTMNPTGYCWSAYIVLAIYDADGTNRYELPPTVDGNADDGPMISPDGQYIIYGKAVGASDPSNIYRIRLNGTSEQKLTNYSSSQPNHPQVPIWADDDNIFYGLASTSSSKDFVLRRHTISTGTDVVIPCGLPNCLPADFLTNSPPVAKCHDVTVEAGPGCVAYASIDNGSYDPDGDTVMITKTPSGPYPLGETEVTLTITDYLGASDTCTATVTVVDTMPPIIVAATVEPQLVAVGQTVSFDGMVGDECDPTIEWDFGDGETSGELVTTHKYVEAGIYSVILTTMDSSANWSAEEFMVVVYDPDGGFVTGEGWIWSPEGAFADNPSATGKADFGFVSKYKKGAAVPTGQTEFVFQAENLNFHSSSYEWLVVTGSNYARFKGTGTINDYGPYKFMLWAGDAPDTFRIRIWEEDEAGNEFEVYDNGFDQKIDGGSIVMHTK